MIAALDGDACRPKIRQQMVERGALFDQITELMNTVTASRETRADSTRA